MMFTPRRCILPLTIASVILLGLSPMIAAEPERPYILYRQSIFGGQKRRSYEVHYQRSPVFRTARWERYIDIIDEGDSQILNLVDVSDENGNRRSYARREKGVGFNPGSHTKPITERMDENFKRVVKIVAENVDVEQLDWYVLGDDSEANRQIDLQDKNTAYIPIKDFPRALGPNVPSERPEKQPQPAASLVEQLLNEGIAEKEEKLKAIYFEIFRMPEDSPERKKLEELHQALKESTKLPIPGFPKPADIGDFGMTGGFTAQVEYVVDENEMVCKYEWGYPKRRSFVFLLRGVNSDKVKAGNKIQVPEVLYAPEEKTIHTPDGDQQTLVVVEPVDTQELRAVWEKRLQGNVTPENGNQRSAIQKSKPQKSKPQKSQPQPKAIPDLEVMPSPEKKKDRPPLKKAVT